MDSLPLNYSYIDTPDLRDQAIDTLSKTSVIGVDVEGDSLYSYQDKICLIQISGGGENFIFDPLRLDSVQPLARLFKDQAILKIFQGSDYDLSALKRDYQFDVSPIFDTALAARIIGLRKFSLQHLVSIYFQVDLIKAHQKSNWSERPLSESQLDYAYKDTAYLIPLHEILLKEIEKMGRMSQWVEECRRLEATDWRPRAPHPSDFLRIRGAAPLSVESKMALRALVTVRDGIAKEKGRPSFKVMSNDDLITLAHHLPRTEEDLRRVFTRDRAPVYRDPPLWLQAITDGLNATDPLPKKEKGGFPRMTATQERLFIKLKEWRDKQALEENVEPTMVISTTTLKEITLKRPTTSESFAPISALRQWQIKRYGNALLEVIHGLSP